MGLLKKVRACLCGSGQVRCPTAYYPCKTFRSEHTCLPKCPKSWLRAPVPSTEGLTFADSGPVSGQSGPSRCYSGNIRAVQSSRFSTRSARHERVPSILFGCGHSCEARAQPREYAIAKTESPSGEVTESANHKGLSPLLIRAPRKKYQETNNELTSNSYFTCKGKSETILDKKQYIHRESCSSPKKMMSGLG